MKFWTLMFVLYTANGEDVESRVLFPSAAECGNSIEHVHEALSASYDDVVILCDRTRLLSASPRPVARPEGLGE